MPTEEVERFKKLRNIKVVFDVGARTSLDYLAVKPKAEYHLFEPNPEFCDWLIEECKNKPNVYINKYGLSDKEEDGTYDRRFQAFGGGEALMTAEGYVLPLNTLDWYVEKMNITRIDFLKIDTEGYDYKILKGGKKAIELCRYIQYEHWDNLKQFHDLLEKDFTMEYIGGQNVLCKRRKQNSVN